MNKYIGQNIRKYHIISLLGQGGMGSVFKARDTILERDVALKLLSPTLANDDSFVERFRLEARALARLDHPHIVKVYDADWDENKLFIVMEFIEGGSLADLIKQEGALPAALVVKLLEQTASGLDYAHQRGLIHRDIKPANILLDRQGESHLTDFGLVKDTGTSLTADGMRLGTPAYMAPEQIQGEDVTPAMDIYALGIVAYEMLTGRPPFIGNMSSIFEGHLLRTPPSISEFNPSLPPEAQAVIAQVLSKSADGRFPTASSFVHALKQALHLADEAPQGVTVPPVFPSQTGFPSPGGISPSQAGGGGAISGAVRPPSGGFPAPSGVSRPGSGPVQPPSGPIQPGSGPVAVPGSGQHPPSRVQKKRGGAGSFLSGLGLGAAGVVGILSLGLLCLCAGCYYISTQIESSDILPTVMAEASVASGSLITPTLTPEPILPTETPSPTETPVPTETPTEIPVLFQDDFSDSEAAGWRQTRESTGIVDYEQGGYRFLVNAVDFIYWSTPELFFTDVRIEVDATKQGGPDTNEFGIICRYVDADNFYFLTATSDGYYSISKYENDEFVALTADTLVETDAVNQGNAVNHLRADCVGSTLSLYVNGVLVETLTDTTFASGDVGLIVGSYDEAGADVVFDNFVVYQP